MTDTYFKLLKEDGDKIIQENEYFILLETQDRIKGITFMRYKETTNTACMRIEAITNTAYMVDESVL